MAEKIWDPIALDRRSGTFKLILELPEEIHPETNPDGSRPEITLHVDTKGKARHSLQVLENLRENDEEQQVWICWDFGMTFVPDELKAGWESPDNPTAEQLKAVMEYVRPDWSEPVELAEAVVTAPELGDGEVVTISVTVPSAKALMWGLRQWLDLRLLNRVLGSFMPDLEDNGGLDDEDESE